MVKLSSFTKLEILVIREYANFTKDEELVFDRLVKNVPMSTIADELGMCERNAYRVAARVRDKIYRVSEEVK